ncbi:triple QxxK/R motif-containing protein isoform X1 [Zalophus californianus]|uniref:Triple QxxK/R motif-containing protein n=1 Tax=Zalophus californianus TaxID=9704 RepID=A0A6J2E3X9_ZALCA|nr:triple QxxK/R motif-containing protein isoform X1 [Zalophus californianus]
MDGYSSHLTTVLCCDESMNTKLSSRGETAFESDCVGLIEGFLRKQAFWRSKMGRKDASTIKLPVDQYRKQIGKQDYKKTKPILRATKLKAEAKKTAIGIKHLPYFSYLKITLLDNKGRKIISPYQICSLLVICQHCTIGPDLQTWTFLALIWNIVDEN